MPLKKQATRYGGAEAPDKLHPSAHRRRVVDVVITDLGVFTIDEKGGSCMTLIELAEGVSVEEVKPTTEAEFRVTLGERQAPAAV